MTGTEVRRWLRDFGAALEYGVVLPGLARLPLRWAYWLSDLRGRWNAWLARDWTELALNLAYVGERSAWAYRNVCPEASESQIRQWVIERYQTVAREELDGALTLAGRLQDIRIDMAAVHAALDRRDARRGLVVVMSHHDSFFMAMMALAKTGVRAHLMISDVVFDERVPPRLRTFTRLKYEAYVGHLNGGQFLQASAAHHAFFKTALERGEVLMVVTDTPADRSPDKGTWVSWLGKRRRMADGAVRIALETNSQLMAVHVRHQAPGVQDWRSSSLVDPLDFPHLQGAALREAVYAPLAAFLEHAVRSDPGRWSAAHLLAEFPCEEEHAHAN